MLRETKITKNQIKLLITLVSSFIFQTGYVFSQINQSAKQADLAPFRSRLMNVEASRNETFRYQATLENRKSSTLVYQLQADLPEGWQANFLVEGTPVRSLEMSAGKSYEMNIEVNPSLLADPGKKTIQILAISNSDTLNLTLEAVVKGSFSLELTTPTGKLNDELVAGSKKELLFNLKNNGTLALKDIELASQVPKNWTLTFDNSQIKELSPGKSLTVKGYLEVPKKSIAGDYLVKVSAKNANSNADSTMRIQVKTSIWTGLWGMIIIAVSVAIIFLLIRKFGRR